MSSEEDEPPETASSLSLAGAASALVIDCFGFTLLFRISCSRSDDDELVFGAGPFEESFDDFLDSSFVFDEDFFSY